MHTWAHHINPMCSSYTNATKVIIAQRKPFLLNYKRMRMCNVLVFLCMNFELYRHNPAPVTAAYRIKLRPSGLRHI